MEEVCVGAIYNLTKLLLKMVEYHGSIMESELEIKAREKEEIMKEKERLERLKMRLVLYLGDYSENVKMYFNDEEILLIERLCYFLFTVNRNVIKVDEKIMEELEKFYAELKGIINMKEMVIGYLN